MPTATNVVAILVSVQTELPVSEGLCIACSFYACTLVANRRLLHCNGLFSMEVLITYVLCTTIVCWF